MVYEQFENICNRCGNQSITELRLFIYESITDEEAFPYETQLSDKEETMV